MLKFLRGFRYAFQGLVHCLKTQINFQIECICAVLAICISYWLGLNSTEWAILALTLAGVLSSEMFNTALETTLNVISREHHPEIGLAKDIAASSVLMWAGLSLCVGICLWWSKLASLLS